MDGHQGRCLRTRKRLPPHRRHRFFLTPSRARTCSAPPPGPELRAGKAEGGRKRERTRAEEGECAHSKSCATKLRGGQKPGFSQQPINRRMTYDGGNEKDACCKSRRRKTSTASSRWLSADTPLTHRHPLPLAPLGGPPREPAPCPGFPHTQGLRQEAYLLSFSNFCFISLQRTSISWESWKWSQC